MPVSLRVRFAVLSLAEPRFYRPLLAIVGINREPGYCLSQEFLNYNSSQVLAHLNQQNCTTDADRNAGTIEAGRKLMQFLIFFHFAVLSTKKAKIEMSR